MMPQSRRRVLLTAGGAGSLLIAGCLSIPGSPQQDAPSATETSSPESPNGTTTGSLTEWERSTDCEEKHDGMHDSVIKVEQVRDGLGSQYTPIQYSSLSAGEKELLDTVTTVGGYGTCDTSDAFNRFVDRVMNHRQYQDQDIDGIYLERDETYYRLYVEKQDQVFAY